MKRITVKHKGMWVFTTYFNSDKPPSSSDWLVENSFTESEVRHWGLGRVLKAVYSEHDKTVVAHNGW